MSGIEAVAEFKRVLPDRRKTQREALALLVATMLEVRGANLMDLAAALPRAAERADMRYQWIARVLGNESIEPDAVMAPFAREVLARAAGGGHVVLILDQSKLSERHQVLMLALRFGERALPLAWRVEATQGPIGLEVHKHLLDAVAPWLAQGARVCLMADRFYGTADLIALCQARGWGARLGRPAPAEGQPHGARPLRRDHDGGPGRDGGGLPEGSRTHGPALTDQHRRHPRSRPRRTLNRRHVGRTRLPDDAGLLGALGHRADVLRFQVARLRR